MYFTNCDENKKEFTLKVSLLLQIFLHPIISMEALKELTSHRI